MVRRMLLLWLLLSHTFLLTFGQDKSLQAVKASQPPRIDGVLDDAAWQDVPVATDFIQNYPAYGQPASVRTEVRIVYDDAAVYIGARLYDNPALIRRQLTARDAEQQQDVDYFSVFFDTYNDDQNGFQFLVTSANVQTDAKLDGESGGGYGNFGDRSWDAVWQSRTATGEDGWVAEMRIPYISLRFAKKEVQDWGLQLLRFTRRNNESAYWDPVHPNINGFVNQFGKFTGLRDIQPPLRLSFSPYLSGGVRYEPGRSGPDWLRNGGMDVKYGINESFTLDATLIPDFGQVISDNLINNLSPFEVQFQENRPFFTEGTELFNKAGLFYSRRVGATPAGYYAVQSFAENTRDWHIHKNPSVTQLYNAIKLSGRTRSKLGIGVFNAVTAPMRAELTHRLTGRDTLVQTEPMSNYNILVLDQALRGRSFLTFTNTNVTRKGRDRDANVSSMDWSLFTKDNDYQFRGYIRYSSIFGYTPYSGNINLIYDTATVKGQLMVKPYNGYNTSLRFGKMGGKIRYYASASAESNTYDPNDLGYNQAPNEVVYAGNISYNQFTPTDRFINYNYSLTARYNMLYKPYAFTKLEVFADAFWIFRNFWDVSLTVGTAPKWMNDYFELRTPGRFLKRPWDVFLFANGSTDSRKRLFISYEFGFAEAALKNNPFYLTELGLRYRFSNRLTMSVESTRQHDKGQIGYAFLRENNGDPIIGYRDNRDLTTVISGIYNFSPRMNLTLRARHYWNKVQYLSFYNVAADGAHIPRAFIPGRDENVNIFNLDAFFTWDFRPGSRVIAGWKNWLGNEFSIDPLRYRNYMRNFRQTFNLPHGNELTLRLIYFLDYNALRKKR